MLITEVAEVGLGLLGAAESAMPNRRGQLGAVNLALGHFGPGTTRCRRFGAGHFAITEPYYSSET